MPTDHSLMKDVSGNDELSGVYKHRFITRLKGRMFTPQLEVLMSSCSLCYSLGVFDIL